MADWANIVSIAAAVSGMVAAAAASASAARATRRQRDDLRRLTLESQARAIESSNIEILGKYLVDDIGAVRVSDVVSDDRVRRQTLQAFSRVARFIGGDPTGEGVELAAAPTSPPRLSSEELNRAREQILAGEIWNGLALMRRHLEILLRQSDSSLETARIGAGQLISAAARIDALPQEVVPQLRYAVSVANKAIHGEPVGVDVALEAVDSADYGLRRMRLRQGRPEGGSQ